MNACFIYMGMRRSHLAGGVSYRVCPDLVRRHVGKRSDFLQNDLVAAGYLARTVDGDYGSTTKKQWPYSRRPRVCR